MLEKILAIPVIGAIVYGVSRVFMKHPVIVTVIAAIPVSEAVETVLPEMPPVAKKVISFGVTAAVFSISWWMAEAIIVLASWAVFQELRFYWSNFKQLWQAG